MSKEALKMVDDEGENQAVRMFLALYGGACGVTVDQMRKHLKMSGFDGAWPEWANDHNGHLTKAGAQLWIRHLFALAEQPAPRVVDCHATGVCVQSGLRADQTAPVQGWKLVPVEPTQKMLDAPPNAYPADALVTWKAMLAAAPQPAVQQCMDHGECFGGKCIYPAPQPAPVQQEPVARVIDDGTPEGATEWIPFNNRVEPLKTGDFLYTSPPAQRKPLTGWIDPNDKTQKQYLPHIGEPVLFCHGGKTYIGKHNGGSFQTEVDYANYFNTWECHWMRLPAAHNIKEQP